MHSMPATQVFRHGHDQGTYPNERTESAASHSGGRKPPAEIEKAATTTATAAAASDTIEGDHTGRQAEDILKWLYRVCLIETRAMAA